MHFKINLNRATTDLNLRFKTKKKYERESLLSTLQPFFEKKVNACLFEL